MSCVGLQLIYLTSPVNRLPEYRNAGQLVEQVSPASYAIGFGDGKWHRLQSPQPLRTCLKPLQTALYYVSNVHDVQRRSCLARHTSREAAFCCGVSLPSDQFERPVARNPGSSNNRFRSRQARSNLIR